MKTINLTPKGFTGPDAAVNGQRAEKAMEAQRDADCSYVQAMTEILDVCGGWAAFSEFMRKQGLMDREEAEERIAELKAIIQRRKDADEELLRSVAGAPPALKA